MSEHPPQNDRKKARETKRNAEIDVSVGNEVFELPDSSEFNALFDLYNHIPSPKVLETYKGLKNPEEKETFLKGLRYEEDERKKKKAFAELAEKNDPQNEEMERFFSETEANQAASLLEADVERQIQENRKARRTSEEYTPKEWREKLSQLVGKLEMNNKAFEKGAKETIKWWASSEEHLIRRNEELEAQAEKILGLERRFRSWGEAYNKLPFKYKLALGVSLGLGTAATAGTLTVAFPLLGIAAQRILGLSTMYLKYEKDSHDEAWGKNKEWGKQKSMFKAGVYTVLLGLTMKEAIEYVSQTELAQVMQTKVEGWFGNMLGHTAPSESDAAVAERIAPVGRVEVASETTPAPVAIETHAAPVHHEIPKVAVARIVSEPMSTPPEPTGSPITEGPNVRIDDDIRQRALASVAYASSEAPAEKIEFYDPTGEQKKLTDFQFVSKPAMPETLAVEHTAPPMVTPEELDPYFVPAQSAAPQEINPLETSVPRPIPEMLISPEPIPTVDITHEQDIANQRIAEAGASQSETPMATEAPLLTKIDRVPINPKVPTLYEVQTPAGEKYLAAYGGSDEERFSFIQDQLSKLKGRDIIIRYAHTVKSMFGDSVRVEDLSPAPEGANGGIKVDSYFIQPKAPNPTDFNRPVGNLESFKK